MRISPDYRLSRLTSPLPLTDITIDYSFISPQPSIATFSLFPSRNNSPSNASSGQSFSSMIQSNDLGCWFQVSGKAPQVCWVTTKSGVCWAAHCSLMLADLGGQQRFVQFNRIISGIKTEIPASKESSEAAVPCVQGRIFADGVDKKVTSDVLCSVSSISRVRSPSLTRPHHCSIHGSHWHTPDTAQNILRTF